MTAEERVASLHARMAALRQRRERRKTGAVGAAGLFAAACLLTLVFPGGTAHPCGTAEMYSGAAILFEGAGGYVLVAVVAATAAMIITALCMHLHRKNTAFLHADNHKDRSKEERIHEEEQS